MWSPDRPLRALALGAGLAASSLLAACTVSPVHAPGGGAVGIALEAPENRLEQIAYRTLDARLDFSQAPGAPRLDLRIRTRTERLGLSDVDRPVDERQLIVTIDYTVTDSEGAPLARGTRSAGSTYANSDQELAADAARIAAEERAVAAAAEAVRLALLARFPAS